MNSIIIVLISRLLIPLIIAFGIYTQINSSESPGGGFQAGVILASAFILHSLVFGYKKTTAFLSEKTLQLFASLGILLYAGTGFLCMALGKNFLDYNALSLWKFNGQKIGILAIEYGVGITVFSVVCIIYFTLSKAISEFFNE